ncbi:hypothetical protein MK632_31965 [Rhizobium changzhiense]|uniref:hypothetical protein n=1 Tax=Rhizobium changzhiense TaxID=2692317 RepID=UPI001F0BFA25|nr:hypothetical protein [Rhizobium changzhiense]MCH4550324.1 hypothetical protein [Rhizobium changzhiense]
MPEDIARYQVKTARLPGTEDRAASRQQYLAGGQSKRAKWEKGVCPSLIKTNRIPSSSVDNSRKGP